MNRKNVTLTIALVVFSALGFTGCIIREDNYVPPPQQPVGYQNVFNEDFNNDRRGWTFDDPRDSVHAFVTDGLYKFVDYSYAGGYHITAVPTGAQVNRDFLVQTRIKSNNAMALIFGASNNSYGYSFFVDDQGYFAVYKEGSPTETILNWQSSTAIRTGYNDVELEQVNDYWYGYINGVKVFQLPARYLSGSQCGFMVLPNTTGYADYLTVKW